MSEKITIRTANTEDAVRIAEHNMLMAEETEDKSLEETVILAGVRNLMNQPEYGFYLVAEIQDDIAASLLITYEWSDWNNGLYWWIQSVYVRKKYRNQGIYSQMYNHLKSLARKKGVKSIQLYVMKTNDVARKTYESLGMQLTPYQIYEELLE